MQNQDTNHTPPVEQVSNLPRTPIIFDVTHLGPPYSALRVACTAQTVCKRMRSAPICHSQIHSHVVVVFTSGAWTMHPLSTIVGVTHNLQPEAFATLLPRRLRSLPVPLRKGHTLSKPRSLPISPSLTCIAQSLVQGDFRRRLLVVLPLPVHQAFNCSSTAKMLGSKSFNGTSSLKALRRCR